MLANYRVSYSGVVAMRFKEGNKHSEESECDMRQILEDELDADARDEAEYGFEMGYEFGDF